MRFAHVTTVHLGGLHQTFRRFLALTFVGLVWGFLDTSSLFVTVVKGAEIGQAVRDNGSDNAPCLHYESKIFSLACDFDWADYYDANDHILLEANEIFNGNDHKINLTELSANSWDGLFKIDSTVERENAPKIQHVHMIGGKTRFDGGFLVQTNQNNFIVNSCSSSGPINGVGSGGICGSQCSGTILLINCWSTGHIKGIDAGGIVGRSIGINSGHVNITNCWSEGDIDGIYSGGICGSHAGHKYGHVNISECFTLGEISGLGSGGITGGGTGGDNGLVEITNCYTRGDITVGDWHAGGGICGTNTGRNNGVVIINNVYSSGDILDSGTGGIIGQIHEDANKIKIAMSVYNGVGHPIIGPDHTGGSNVTQLHHNSNNLDDIKGKVYCSQEVEECWDTDRIWKAVPPDNFPILQMLRISPSPLPSSTKTPTVTRTRTRSSTLTSTQRPSLSPTPNNVPDTEIGQEIRENGVGKTACLTYDNQNKTFSLTCDFDWANYYDAKDFIMLEANEIFNGNDYKINLDGLGSWDGLFKINSTAVQWENAPKIQHVHMIGGATSLGGGFIVQANQHNFTVDSCSSSGAIPGRRSFPSGDAGGGGICGRECSGTILLINCWSTGNIQGFGTGGIAGWGIGINSGHVIITECWSKGDIGGSRSGGICGSHAGENRGSVTIAKSYSSGRISGPRSGGICGWGIAITNGHVDISECYTIGEISGSNSGGITGGNAGDDNGVVEITNCYTRGDITGNNHAGGICGTSTGLDDGVVIINNVYASGNIIGGAGGIIGGTSSTTKKIKITMSVYNTGPIIGSGGSNTTQLNQNSDDLGDINGTVYCPQEANECWDTNMIWKAMPPHDFPILQAQLLPLPSTTPARTQMPTSTGTLTPTRTQTETRSATLTSTQTPFSFPTGTPTSANTVTTTSTVSSSFESTPKLETGNSTLEEFATDYGPIVGVISLLLLCVFYVLHKRRKNRSATKEYATKVKQYVKQQQASQVKENSSAIQEEGEKIEEHTLPREYPTGRRLSALSVNGSTVNPLRIAAATNVFEFATQNIEVIEATAMKNSKRSSGVKVVSVKTPNLSEASTRSESMIHLARIEDIDTSEMKFVDRTVLKLRKWKAFLLAEASPMVEVKKIEKLPGTPHTTSQRQEAFIERLAYAKKRGGERSAIDDEIQSHSQAKREEISQQHRKRKEFPAVPRAIGRFSFSKTSV